MTKKILQTYSSWTPLGFPFEWFYADSKFNMIVLFYKGAMQSRKPRLNLSSRPSVLIWFYAEVQRSLTCGNTDHDFGGKLKNAEAYTYVFTVTCWFYCSHWDLNTFSLQLMYCLKFFREYLRRLHELVSVYDVR